MNELVSALKPAKPLTLTSYLCIKAIHFFKVLFSVLSTLVLLKSFSKIILRKELYRQAHTVGGKLHATLKTWTHFILPSGEI